MNPASSLRTVGFAIAAATLGCATPTEDGAADGPKPTADATPSKTSAATPPADTPTRSASDDDKAEATPAHGGACDGAAVRASLEKIATRTDRWTTSEGAIVDDRVAAVSAVWTACSPRPAPIERYLDALVRHPVSATSRDPLASTLPGHAKIHGEATGVELGEENHQHLEFWSGLVEKACPSKAPKSAEALQRLPPAAVVIADCKLREHLRETETLEAPGAAATAVRLASIAYWVGAESGEPDLASVLLRALLRGPYAGLSVRAGALPQDMLLPGLTKSGVVSVPAAAPPDILVDLGAITAVSEVATPLKNGELPAAERAQPFIGPLFDILSDALEIEAQLGIPGRPLIVAVDRRVPWETALRVDASARKAGFKAVRLLVLEQDTDLPVQTIAMPVAKTDDKARTAPIGDLIAALE